MKEEVMKTLKKLQKGYSERDETNVDNYIEEIFCDDITIIGTGAIEKGGYEWCVGKNEVRDLLVSDWEHWGDLEMDLEDVDIKINKNTAWASIYGTLSIHSSEEEEFSIYLDAVDRIIDQDKTEKEKVFDLVREGFEVIYQTEQGSDYIWPIRLTAVLIDEGHNWKFTQIHFSYPTRRHPDVREDV